MKDKKRVIGISCGQYKFIPFKKVPIGHLDADYLDLCIFPFFIPFYLDPFHFPSINAERNKNTELKNGQANLGCYNFYKVAVHYSLTSLALYLRRWSFQFDQIA